MDKLEYSVGTLNDVLETYRKNLATIAEMGRTAEGPKTTEQGKVIVPAELRKTQEIAEWGNEAVVAGLAATWEGLAGQLNALRKFGGKMVDPSAEQGIIRQIEAVRDALGEILNMADDPKAAQLLSRMQDFLGRNAPAAPTAPSVDDFRELQTPGMKRLSPGPSSRRSSPLWDRQLVGLGTSDAGPIGDYVEHLAEKAEVATLAFDKLNEQGKQFEALAGTLADRVADTNVQLVDQAGVLGTLREGMPELDAAMTGFFDRTAEGAAELDGAVAAMGERFLDAFEGAVVRGESLSDVLKGLALDLAEMALQQAKLGDLFGGGSTGGGGLLGGLFGKLGDLFGGGTTAAAAPAATQSFAGAVAQSVIWTAKGNAFDRGRLASFARGGALTNSIVDRPTLFPMADGAGLMGESGPEAVLPLTRLANGDLGVSMPGGAPLAAGGTTIVYNIQAPGADREGLRAVIAELHRLGARQDYLDRTIDRRAVNAVNWVRSRGPW